jgi:putative cardiolipin synthase
MLGMIADLVRINKRMHNKSFTADGEVAIVGGRNIGDEYFGANEAMNFADLDVGGHRAGGARGVRRIRPLLG